MKIATLPVLILSLMIAVNRGDDVPDCATLNINDLATCSSHCSTFGPIGDPTYASATQHGDTVEGAHVDFLIGFDCKCGGMDECFTKYDLPTCASRELGECNAAKTCEDLCGSLELHSDGDTHVCEHVNHDGNDHVRRILEVHDHGDDHDDDKEKVPFTLCFCRADPEKDGDGTMVCGDEGWKAEDGHDEEEKSGAFATNLFGEGCLASLVMLTPLAATVAFIM